jgi:transcriptional regulator with GAF, ATPase, and Fis domain
VNCRHEKGSFTAPIKKIGKFELAKARNNFPRRIGDGNVAPAKYIRSFKKRFERSRNEIIKAMLELSRDKPRLRTPLTTNNSAGLFYRLSSSDYIPPLRERRGDIVVLVEHFITSFNKKLGKNITGLTKPALKIIYDYDWPGNVRELENTLERCLILAETNQIDVDVLPVNIVSQFKTPSNITSGQIFEEGSPIIPFEKLKEEAIKHALKSTDGNIVDAARKLKIGRATLYRLRINIKSYVIRRKACQ